MGMSPYKSVLKPYKSVLKPDDSEISSGTPLPERQSAPIKVQPNGRGSFVAKCQLDHCSVCNEPCGWYGSESTIAKASDLGRTHLGHHAGSPFPSADELVGLVHR